MSSRQRPIRAGSARKLGLAVVLACLAAGLAAAEATQSPGAEAAQTVWTGRSLTDALRDLQARGLKIVFTSNVVRPEMMVTVEPASTDLRGILDELLAPHGLLSQDGPNGTVVVVPRPGEAPASRRSITGSVRGRPDLAPVAGARVRAVEIELEVPSDPDGGFRIPDPGSGSYTLEVTAEGFVTSRVENVVVGPEGSAELTILLDPIPFIEEELVVTPSRLSLLRQEPVGRLGLSRDEILGLPHLGDDLFRALTLLPGTAGNDVSARFNVRGGRRDETQILLDGQELYEAFHLQDYDSALSFVAPTTLDSADLTTGGFPVEYGDRMSGVLEMTTVTPTGKPQFRVGASILSVQAGSTGAFQRGRGSWIAEIRRGEAALIKRLLGNEEPKYWDAFGKLDYQLAPSSSLRANLLGTGDELEFEEVVEGERKRFETEYRSSYVWLTNQTILSDRLLVETGVSQTQIDRDRRGLELEEDARFVILDVRDSEILGLRQSWHLQAADRHLVRWGWRWRDFDTAYDYSGSHSFDNPLAQIRHDGEEGETVFADRFREQHQGVYLSDRLQPFRRLTVELGLRFDRHTQTQESRISPRFALAAALGERSVLRLAWGRFNQSQRPYEIQVEDGEIDFHPVERSEHRVLGFEKRFRGGESSPGMALRVEVYQREVQNPRPRYENLYEPINTFPEVEPERVRIAPDRSFAEGLEIFLRGRSGRKLGWWINYTLASTEDEIGGARFRRIFDQTHSLNLDLDYRVSERWRLNLAWRYHTGWPTTPLSTVAVEDDEGEIEFVPRLGPLNSDRLPSYHRLDLRASRRWRFRGAALDLFVDVQNVYDRLNVAGFDFEIDDEDGSIVAQDEEWSGLLPSAGIAVAF